MSTLHQKRQKFASVLEKACKRSTSSCPSESSSTYSSEGELNMESSRSSKHHRSSSSSILWGENTSTTPLIDSLHSMSWPVNFLSSDGIPPSSQLSPCIDGDSWPSDSPFSCPWNSSSMDFEFLEADKAEKMLTEAISPEPEVSQTSMDLLDFLDDQNHTISHLGACMNMDDPLFNSIDNPEFSMFTDLQFDPQQEWLKSDTWMNVPTTSNNDLDDLFMRSAPVKTPPSYQARLSAHQPTKFYSDMAKGLSTCDYFHCVADRVTKKRHSESKEMSPTELFLRKERNRLRSKAYRLRRKMQYESMKKEVTQTRKELQIVHEQIQNIY